MEITNTDTGIKPQYDGCYIKGVLVFGEKAPAVYYTGGATPEAFIIMAFTISSFIIGFLIRGDFNKVNPKSYPQPSEKDVIQ